MILQTEVPIKKKKYGVAAKYFDESNMVFELLSLRNLNKNDVVCALLYLRVQYFSILS